MDVTLDFGVTAIAWEQALESHGLSQLKAGAKVQPDAGRGGVTGAFFFTLKTPRGPRSEPRQNLHTKVFRAMTYTHSFSCWALVLRGQDCSGPLTSPTCRSVNDIL